MKITSIVKNKKIFDNQLIIYQIEDGKIRLDVKFE